MRVLITVVIASLLWPGTASAQAASADALSLRLTLEEAIARAQAESHRLADLRARQAAAAAAVEQRHAADLPIVALRAGYQRTNHVEEFGLRQPDGRLNVFYPDVPDNWLARLDMQWPIYSGGRSNARTGVQDRRHTESERRDRLFGAKQEEQSEQQADDTGGEEGDADEDWIVHRVRL